ncbi:LysR family transcriptional regulator [Kitasatospora sp. NBC_01287]|uniref:LysR family transcriptional regulator n=1 Tax=Kitasatospora sp. NBC_01287 TaxID=2903573 RepID=UPI00225503C2|nr:LysR family transcriptional regulator [Kitasatospora sp. NBC_01287]MCX4745887.1 LysR family transcriptional regulator [Kitasatospora sp. NBC_01287]
MDLNLLRALDVLLQENSVTRAAERLGTSPAAASRMLGKLRRAAGDPLLVRAGQRLVPTPRALELRERVRELVQQSDALFVPAAGFEVARLERTFTIQAGDLLLAGLAAPLIDRVRALAPGVDLVFVPESAEGGPALRQGDIDLEWGVLDHLDPETRTESLARVSLVAVARGGHPLFDHPMDPRRFAEADHIGISRRGKRHGPIDTALARLGLRRRVAAVVPGHTSALLLTRSTDLVSLTLAGRLPDTIAALGLRTFPIPLDVPPLDVGMAWHPRNTSDPAHRWFRDQIRATTTHWAGQG